MGFHYRWFDRDQEKTDEMGIPLTRADIDAREHAKQEERIFRAASRPASSSPL